MGKKILHRRYGLRFEDGTPHELYQNYINYTGGLVCRPDEMVYDITFEECGEKESDMVAWRYAGREEVDFIFKDQILLSVCFPYGLEAEVKAGRGEVVFLKEISSRACGPAGELAAHRAEWDQ